MDAAVRTLNSSTYYLLAENTGAFIIVMTTVDKTTFIVLSQNAIGDTGMTTFADALSKGGR